MPELTQEQIDKLISEAKQGLFTKEDLEKEITREADRRVELGIQKGIETQKSKWAKELEEKAKLSAEEIARREFQEKEQLLTARELEAQKKENRILAKELLANADIPKDKYEKVLGLLISENSDTTTTNVNSFIDIFNSTKTDIETKIRASLSDIKKPKLGETSTPTSIEEFNKMSYSQKFEFKKTHPEQYKEFIT